MEELKALFEELEGIYRTMVFVGGVVGLRVSEVIGLPASPTLDGIRPLWGQTMNADFVKPAAVALGLASKSERLAGTASVTV